MSLIDPASATSILARAARAQDKSALPNFGIPAQAGIQFFNLRRNSTAFYAALDFRLRGNDGKKTFALTEATA